MTGIKNEGLDASNPLPLQFFHLEWSWYQIICWEFLVTFVICFGYFVMAHSQGVERGMLSYTMASFYSVFILSMFNCYYSRYNFTWSFVSSLTSFELDLKNLWILIGGILGSLFSVFCHLMVFKPAVNEDVQNYLIKEELTGEI